MTAVYNWHKLAWLPWLSQRYWEDAVLGT